jgi:hypothetical protein
METCLKAYFNLPREIREPRDQFQPGIFLNKREKPGNEVVAREHSLPGETMSLNERKKEEILDSLLTRNLVSLKELTTLTHVSWHICH